MRRVNSGTIPENHFPMTLILRNGEDDPVTTRENTKKPTDKRTEKDIIACMENMVTMETVRNIVTVEIQQNTCSGGVMLKGEINGVKQKDKDVQSFVFSTISLAIQPSCKVFV